MDNKYVKRAINLSFAALFFASYVTVANIMELRNSCAQLTEQVAAIEQEVQELKEETVVVVEIEEPVEENPEPAPQPEPEPKPATTTTSKNSINWDYNYVLRVVAAESRGESLKGQMAVAQCIRETAKATSMTPEQVVKVPNQYASPISLSAVTDSVREACNKVFINGESVTDKPIKYFYSTAGGFVSKWHENSLTYVTTIGYHKFFM